MSATDRRASHLEHLRRERLTYAVMLQQMKQQQRGRGDGWKH